MKIAPKPKDENLRLKTLFSYDILDTSGELIFDELTQLASEICETPIALISLVDPDRQWFKAKVGLDADETSRDIAFCAHAILDKELFEVPNTLEDARFFDNPLVTEGPKIRFYAGTQLLAPNGQAIGTLCAISDKPKELTVQQKKALTILGREVIAQLELRKHILSIEEANQNKTEFLSRISHEIRTPLNAILGFSDVLLERANTYQLPDEANQYIKHIHFSGQHLLALINSVLDLNKIEAGKMELQLELVCLMELVQNIYTMLANEAKRKSLIFTLECATDLPKYVTVDGEKLTEVLVNLVSNSIKFSDAGATVLLKISQQKNQEICFEVIDQGMGISAADQALLFSKYKQVGNHKRGGTGIGLNLCKGLVELMGGSLYLTSELGKGTHVQFYLPAKECKTPAAIATAPSHLHQSLRTLIVEDNPLNQMVANALFKSIGCDVTLATTGEEAIKILKQTQFDCILMDIMLPGISGHEALQQIKQLGITTPIVVMTADVFSGDYLKQGFDAFISKPIERQVVINTLNRMMNV